MHLYAVLNAIALAVILIFCVQKGTTFSQDQVDDPISIGGEQLLTEWYLKELSYSFDVFTIDVTIHDTENGITTIVPVTHIRYDENVFFDFDKYDLSNTSVLAISDLADFIKKQPNLASVLVVGHTDSKGTDEYNSELSRRRALAVLNELIIRGVPSRILGAVPMGETQPIVSNREPGGRARNRRVEFFLSADDQASRSAVERVKFDPCFRNDQDENWSAENCGEYEFEIPILNQTGAVSERPNLSFSSRKEIDTPAVPPRPVLAPGPVERPLLGE